MAELVALEFVFPAAEAAQKGYAAYLAGLDQPLTPTDYSSAWAVSVLAALPVMVELLGQTAPEIETAIAKVVDRFAPAAAAGEGQTENKE